MPSLQIAASPTGRHQLSGRHRRVIRSRAAMNVLSWGKAAVAFVQRNDGVSQSCEAISSIVADYIIYEIFL